MQAASSKSLLQLDHNVPQSSCENLSSHGGSTERAVDLWEVRLMGKFQVTRDVL